MSQSTHPISRWKTAVTYALFAAIPTVLAGDAWSSPPQAACHLQTTALVDTFALPHGGGDADFFTVDSTAIPNLTMLIDTSGSMKALPLYPTNNGCPGPDPGGDDFQKALAAAGYDPTRNYWLDPPNRPSGPGGFDCEPETSVGNNNKDIRYCNLFGCDFNYVAGGVAGGACLVGHDNRAVPYRDTFWKMDNGCCNFSETRRGDVDWACNGDAQCESCLQTMGYWRDGSSNMYFSGNFLNFMPPKYGSARRVTKDIIGELGRIRLGIAIFGNAGAQWLLEEDPDTPGDIGSMRMRPHCNQLGHEEQNAKNRETLRNAINNLTIGSFNQGTPLAKALYHIGQYFIENDNPHLYTKWFGSDAPLRGSKNDGSGFMESNPSPSQRSFCWSCQFSATVIVTDGWPNESRSVPDEIRDLEHGESSTEAEFIGTPMQCAHFDEDRCNDYGDNRILHKVAWWLWNHDLRPKQFPPGDFEVGHQRMATYAVAYAVPSAFTLLQETAHQGGGMALEATDLSELKDSILQIIEDVIQRSSSFTTTTINNVQSQAAQSVLMPRFEPSPRAPWPGYLYRFDLLSEFALGEDLGGGGGGMYLVDRGCYPAGTLDTGAATCKPIGSDPVTGRFFRKEGWEPDAEIDLGSPAEPFWEAGDRLQDAGSDARNMWTVLFDDDGNPEVTEFTESNAAALAPYIGLTGAECVDTLFYLGSDLLPIAIDEGLVDPNDLTGNPEHDLGVVMAALMASPPVTVCTRAVIRFIRGKNMNGLGDRDRILADIFHSTPTIIEPPTRPDLLMTAFRNPQTMVTLGLSNDLFESESTGDSAYHDFFEMHKHRPRVALVGSNGGMMHAFDAGAYDRQVTGDWDRGTGDELWAFVPPTVLPRLKRLLPNRRAHEYFVDGDTWVRNIWADGLGDPSQRNYKRNAAEYRTVAVVGKLRGGSHYFALDVTNAHRSDYWTNTSGKNFLWMFPEISSTRALTMGQSWNINQPHPPPIGPIRYKDVQSPALATDYDVNFAERWIVALSGGYDHRNVRGLGFYMLDVYTGEIIWQFARYDGGTNLSSPDDLRKYLRYSFAATPTLTAWGNHLRSTFDTPYFDTMFVPDTGGQIWTARFNDPDPNNWAAARLFEEYRHDSANRVDKDRRPFFQAVQLTVLPESGYLRAYVGTGDRHHLRQPGHGKCGPDNLNACVRAGCRNVQSRRYDVETGAGRILSDWSIDTNAETITHNHFGLTSESNSWCNDSRFRTRTLADRCPQGNLLAYRSDLEWRCGVVDGRYECGPHLGDKGGTWEPNPLSAVTEVDDTDDIRCLENYANNRFYSVLAFGEGRGPFNATTEAEDYDDERITNDEEVLLVKGNDINDPYVGQDAPGWYYEYPAGPEKTASPSVTAGRCVVWSSLQSPHANCEDGAAAGGGGAFGAEAECGGGEMGQDAYMYFRNYVTGAMDCVDPGTLGLDAHGRIHLGSEPQPPPPPQVFTQVSGSGQTRTSIFMGEDSADVAESDTLLNEFSTIVIPSDLHECRHLGTGCN